MARNSACSGKQSFLPPRSPFPSMSPAYIDYGSKPCLVPRGIPKPGEGYNYHQRTSSESFLFEEQPSWLDDLLNEPETPVRRGSHRRSSSDSFAYLDASSIAYSADGIAQEELKHRSLASLPSWGSQELDHQKEMQYSSYYAERNSFGRRQSRGWDSSLNIMTYPSNFPSTRDKVVPQNPGLTDALLELDAVTSAGTEKKDPEESASQDSERREGPHANHPQTEIDPKRVKQKFAQRSRVRKLQYIAELERNVEALQAEISEVSAEMKFLDQQNLILNLENKALKQRSDSLSQEQLLKCFQQEMLEREISRLRALCQQQQQHHPPPQQSTPSHGRTRSRDLDSQFANLSLKHMPQVLDGSQ
uniref:Uncharacterized protein At4g06598 n=2 Tax=Anthurium amnicola TaxID=1678845 RepID=A0A1D1YEY9_9ARAE